MKRVLAAFLCTILVFGIFGCGKKTTSELPTSEATTKGAYVEQTLSIPFQEGCTSQTVAGINAIENGVEAFVIGYMDKGDGTMSEKFYSYKFLDDGTTTSEELTQFSSLDSEVGGMYRFYRSESGSIYFLSQEFDAEYNATSHLSVSENGSKAVELTGDFMTGSQNMNRVSALSNGDIACIDGTLSKVQILDKQGNLKETLETAANNLNLTLTTKNNMISYVGADGKTIVTYDTSSKETKEFKYEGSSAENMLAAYLQLSYGENENLYLCDGSGIYSHSEDGSLWERLIEGSATSLGMPDFGLDGFAVGKGNHPNFYVVDYKSNLLKYSYDENATAGKQEQLSVFSLRENELVRQAVVEFNRTHSEVNVTYNVAMTMETGGIEKDYINALNSELLAGAGPDVIILDGLPIDSYIQKGVLADIKTVVDEAEKILPNILESSVSSNGSLYAIPSGIRLPLGHVKNDQSNAFDSIEALANASEDSTEKPLLAKTAFSYRSLSEILLKYYGKGLLQNSSEATQKFLENAGRISKAIGSSNTLAEGNSDYDGTSQEEIEKSFYTNNIGVQIYDEAKERVQGALFQPMQSLAGGLFITGAAEKFGYHIVGVNGLYEPAGIVGINRASKHTTEASEFIKILLSKKVQSANDYSSQFPMNLEALKAEFDKKENTVSMGTLMNGEIDLYVEWPKEETRILISDLLMNVTTPIVTDRVLIEMLVPMVAAYLDGTDTIEAAMEKIDSVISTYLSE